MSYPDATARVLRHLGYTEDDATVEKSITHGIRILEWNHTDPQPTEAEILAASQSQAFLDWEAERGGDPVLTKRKRVKDAFQSDEGRLLLAFIIAMKKQGVINGTKAQILNAIMAEVDLGEAD